MKYEVSIKWTCGGYINIEANSAQEAFDYVEEELTEKELKDKLGLSDDVYIYTNSICCDDYAPFIEDSDGNQFTWDLQGVVYKD